MDFLEALQKETVEERLKKENKAVYDVLVDHWCKRVLAEMQKSILLMQKQKNHSKGGRPIKGIYQTSLSIVNICESCPALQEEMQKMGLDRAFHPILVAGEMQTEVMASGFFKNTQRKRQIYSLCLTDLAKRALLTLSEQAQKCGIILTGMSLVTCHTRTPRSFAFNAIRSTPPTLTFDIADRYFACKALNVICEPPIEQCLLFDKMRLSYTAFPSLLNQPNHTKI